MIICTLNEKAMIFLLTLTGVGFFENVREWAYNLGHNIVELYDVLIQIWLTTCKTKHAI